MNRFDYYDELKSNSDLINDKLWLKAAFKCVLEEHQNWIIKEENLDRIINNKYDLEDYLAFISLQNELIAEDLRNIEEDNWNELYFEFGKFLNEFYIKFGDESGKVLYETYINSWYYNNDLLPWVKKFSERDVDSLDPVHIYASFNYWKIPEDVRKERIKLFLELIRKNKIDTTNLLDKLDKFNFNIFKKFPHINITQVVSTRSKESQKEIWRFFSNVFNNKIDSDFIKLFDQINKNWVGLRIESTTIFMFWVNPDKFLPLDKNTVALLNESHLINRSPKIFKEYKKLISNKSKYFFRNLVKLAINKDILLELFFEERKEIESFLDGKEIKYTIDKNNIYRSKLDIDLVLNFDFELYFMIDGTIKQIIFENNEIITYKELPINNKPNYNAYPNFQLIAIKSLSEEYSKVLETNEMYYFNENFKIDNNGIYFVNNNAISIYTNNSINNINICAVVGKNGTGKSTIIELLIMAINNISKSLDSDNRFIDNELKNLFYTIHINYSLHSLNEKNYKGKWLNKLFHKRDVYQTPVVIEPFRSNGNIDINQLDKLTKQRLLSTLLNPSIESKNKKLTNTMNATHLEFKLNRKKINKILNKMTSNNATKTKESSLTFNEKIKEVLSTDENIQILKYLISDINFDGSEIQDIAKVYICNKVKSIVNTYKYFKKYQDNIASEEFLKLLVNDKTHITFKLHQAINFLKFNIYKKLESIRRLNNVGIKLTISEISSDISYIQSKNNEIKTIELIPPSFFDVEIILNNNKRFDLLSSGEKQKIYFTSSILYHLQNIDSIHRSQENYLKYKYVNIILDEIELYFHPDMQRTFIKDLLDSIENSDMLNDIVGLNIILITHSPFILSDILKSQTLYLKDNPTILHRPENTFGANIHTLLDNSFFMQDGLIGEYSKKIIKEVISRLNIHKTEIEKNEKDRSLENLIDRNERKYIKQIAVNIGEPFLRKKLLDMYFSLFDTNENQISLLEKERKLIEEKIRKLKNDSNS